MPFQIALKMIRNDGIWKINGIEANIFIKKNVAYFKLNKDERTTMQQLSTVLRVENHY
jgi:hypothetical protein